MFLKCLEPEKTRKIAVSIWVGVVCARDCGGENGIKVMVCSGAKYDQGDVDKAIARRP